MPNPEIKGLLLDLSGTLYIGDRPINGALQAVNALGDAGVPIRYVTNTTSKPRSRILERVRALGFGIRADHVLTPAILINDLLRKHGHRRCHCLLQPEVIEDLSGIEAVGDDPDALIVGDIGEGFTYGTLNRAFDHLMNGAAFYALAANRFFEGDDGLQLDVGPFVAALEYALDRKATLVGKPAPAFFETAVAALGLPANQVAMVGDDIESDVGGAMDAGLTGILVRTGKYRQDTAEGSAVEPHHTLDSIADIPALLGVR